MRRFCLTILIAAAPVFPTGLYAAAVVNGGFETGDLTSWALSGNTDFIGVGSFFPHTGTYALEAGPVGSSGFLRQTVATLPGASYLLSLWLANDCGSSLTCSEPNAFQVSWGDQLLYSANNLPTIDYTQLLFPVIAAGTSTDLTLGFRQDQFSFYIDDVTVEAVPEPSSMALSAIVCLLFCVRWRSRTPDSLMHHTQTGGHPPDSART